MMSRRSSAVVLLAFVFVSSCGTVAQAPPVAAGAAPSTEDLLRGFQDPPNGARPRVWWHWMNGNITKEGIQLDLEWMHRIGLGGFARALVEARP